MSKRMDGRMWKRVKRRDHLEGAASEVRKVAVTPEVERELIERLGKARRCDVPWIEWPRTTR